MYLWCTVLLPDRFCCISLALTMDSATRMSLMVVVKLGEPKGPGEFGTQISTSVPSGPFHFSR